MVAKIMSVFLPIFLMSLLTLTLIGSCKKKSEEEKAIDKAVPTVEQIEEKVEEAELEVELPAEAVEFADMTDEQLKGKLTEHEKLLDVQTAELSSLQNQLKELPVTEMLGDKAKNIKADIEAMVGSIAENQKGYDKYYNELVRRGVEGIEYKL